MTFEWEFSLDSILTKIVLILENSNIEYIRIKLTIICRQ